MGRDPTPPRQAMRQIFTSQTHREAPYLYIGQVAEITGASRKAIRHYEALGLLPPATRRGSYRVYSERDVFLVHMIRHAQSYGFSLAELKELVAAKVRNNRFPVKLAEAMVVRKRDALRRQVDDIRALDKRLVQLTCDIRRNFG
jgi:DNA-binding transcriptional MerR regulator